MTGSVMMKEHVWVEGADASKPSEGPKSLPQQRDPSPLQTTAGVGSPALNCSLRTANEPNGNA